MIFMILTKYEEGALRGEHGDILQMAYRILVATGEATDADRLIPIHWVHLSGVNYNTIGDAGEQFLRSIRHKARVQVRTTLNPAGFDKDTVHEYAITDEFIKKQESIKTSYEMMGVETSFSCIPYDIFDIPTAGTQVSFAESNAAIHANSLDELKTNKESAFSALASALTGKSPYNEFRGDLSPDITVDVDMPNMTELDWGMLGLFAGRVSERCVSISGAVPSDRRACKALCGGMGTSGTCAKFTTNTAPDTEHISFDRQEAKKIHDELNTAETGDTIILGSPQLSLPEIVSLIEMLRGRRFTKRCMLFCPRTVKEAAAPHIETLERANVHLLADCCACLTPLLSTDDTDGVITNSIKGAYYIQKSNGLDVSLKPLQDIIQEHSR